jgi:hypothetical protein
MKMTGRPVLKTPEEAANGLYFLPNSLSICTAWQLAAESQGLFLLSLRGVTMGRKPSHKSA